MLHILSRGRIGSQILLGIVAGSRLLFSPCDGETDWPKAGLLENRDCGAYCLGVAIALHGKDPESFPVLRERVATDSSGECSLQGISDGLAVSGIKSRGIILGPEPAEGVSIIQMGSEGGGESASHFVVVRRVREDAAIVYCPPFWVFQSQWDELRDKAGPVGLQLSDSTGPWWQEFIGKTIACILSAGIGIGIAAKWVTFKKTTREGGRDVDSER